MDKIKRIKIFEADHTVTQARWIYIALILFAGMITKVSGIPNISFPYWLMALLLIAAAANNSVYYFFRWFFPEKSEANAKKIYFITFLQYIIDLLIITSIIHFAGGIESISFVFFFFIIVASGFIYGPRGVFALAFLAIIFYNVLIFGEYLKFFQTFPRYDFSDLATHFSIDAVSTNAYVVSTVILTTALFISYLARLQRRQEEKIIFEKDERIKEAKETDEIRSRFVTVITHQFRTPLTHIKLVLSTLSESKNISEEEKIKHLSEASLSMERVLTLIDTLVKIKDLETDKKNFDNDNVPLGEIVGKAVSVFDPIAARKGIGISCRTEKTESSYIVKGNTQFLLTAVEIMLENAVSYGYSNSEIKVSLLKDEKFFKIQVSNQGQGIPKKDWKKIFLPFYRTDKALRTETDRSGLSLYLVKLIAKKHRGKAYFSSVPQKETTFYLKLPALKERSYAEKDQY